MKCFFVAAALALAPAGCIIREPPPPYYGGPAQPGAAPGAYGQQPPTGPQPPHGEAQWPPQSGEAAPPAHDDEQEGQLGAPGVFTIACRFPDGWVAVLPAHLYDPGDDSLMRALVGLAEEPDSWRQDSQYASFEPYAAQRCGAQAANIDRYPGEYVILVGWAGRGVEEDNGHVEAATLQPGQVVACSYSNTDLTSDWSL
jgi:hypothetical protein